MIEDNISFAWGDKGGLSKNKEVRFYKSFQYDEITYNLFDNVYLFTHDHPEPHVGKIVKIWEHINGAKKVKIVWFFHPSEIRKHLGSYRSSEKELFLGCGENEAVGVADINPLEAIAGKCCVICTLKDERNLPPSQADIERADFVFSRFYNASRHALSDELPSTIALHRLELFLNKKEDVTPEAVPPAISNGDAKNVSADSPSSPIPVPSKPNSLKLSGTAAKRPREGERKSLNIHIPSSREEDGRSGSGLSPICTHGEDKTPPGTLNEDKATKRVKLSHEVAGGSKPPLLSRKTGANGGLKSEKRPVVSTKVLKARNKTEDQVEVPTKRDADGKFKLPVVSTEGLKPGIKAEDQVEVPKKRDADGKLKLPVASTGGLKPGSKAEDEVEGVSRKLVPAPDKTKWFVYSPMAWADRIEQADKDGRLVLLQNFDASLTSSEIEDLILRATQHSCNVRIVTNYTYGDSTYGMAYAIFRSKDAANKVVSQLTKAFLVLPDGRRLLCSKGALKIPKQSTPFTGHLAIDKLKNKLTGEEQKKAVSTSHCSQPNTIEFDMALEWTLVQSRFAEASKKLTEKHKEARERCTRKK